jgi:small subunit ribosomal protein S3
MGQKVNPVGLRIGINKSWQSRWFATRDYARLLKEDMMIRQIIEEQLGNAGISRIEMERTAEEVKVDMYTAKPGMVIGRRGATINDVRQSIEEATGNIIQLNIVEVKKPELVAKLVAESIANQLLGRVSFRRAMKKAISLSLKAGAKGIKIQVSGRLGGAEMARTEWYREGRVPLHTLRANIDYGFAEANTTFGKIGVKVWLYLGDVILDDAGEDKKPAEEPGIKPKGRTKGPKDSFGSRVKKGAKKIKDIRKTVISSGLRDAQEAKTEGEKAKEKPKKKEAKKGAPRTKDKKEVKAKTEKKTDKKKTEDKEAKTKKTVKADEEKKTDIKEVKDKKEDKKDTDQKDIKKKGEEKDSK